MNLNLDISHINRLFDLTDKHLSWYDKYYPKSTSFSKLLKRNYNNLYYFCITNEYDEYVIHNKLDRMFEAYDNLLYITNLNRISKKRDKV